MTGGGTSVIAELFSVAGASSSLLDVRVPYHPKALQEFLNSSANHGCNPATARTMAMQSYLNARQFSADSKTTFGLGCTAAIATNRDRRGTDRCHIAIQSHSFTLAKDLELDKGLSRHEQEAQCKQAILSAMSVSLGIERGSDVLRCDAGQSWQDLLSRESRLAGSCPARGLFPGAFNPVHDGHRQMYKRAVESLGGGVALEISIRNVDKPPLDYLTMMERSQLMEGMPLVFTNAPTFVEKARIMPGITFVVGVDTLTRIQDEKYYASETARDLAIAEITKLGNRFLVFGRSDGSGFVTLDDVEISSALRQLCSGIDESSFRSDISSTEIRKQHEA